VNRAGAGPLYPGGRRVALVISADFELAWAWRFNKLVDNPMADAVLRAGRTRENVPRILELCERHEVPITWATVGALFLDRRSCEREIDNLPVPGALENEFWRVPAEEWYKAYRESQGDEIWHCPGLIESILASKVKHEIGCHTFSHVDCARSPAEVVDAELDACRRAAKRFGVELHTLVFPANYRGNLPVLKRHGYLGYRHDMEHELDRPRQDELGMWMIPGGLELEIKPGWSPQSTLAMLMRVLRRPLPEGTVISLWFHPSFPGENVEKLFPPLFRILEESRDRIWVTTFGELTSHLVEGATGEG